MCDLTLSPTLELLCVDQLRAQPLEDLIQRRNVDGYHTLPRCVRARAKDQWFIPSSGSSGRFQSLHLFVLSASGRRLLQVREPEQETTRGGLRVLEGLVTPLSLGNAA